MSPHELYALVGSLSLGTLTLLYALQWRDNHQPWAAWFAIAFLFHTLRYALHPLTQPAHGLTSTWAMVFLTPSLIAMTEGMSHYIGLHPRAAHAIRWIAITGAVASLLWGAVPGLSVMQAGIVFAVFVTGWAIMAAWATSHEPNSGHGLVFVTMILFPAFVCASMMGWLDATLLRYLAAIPTAIAGITLLSTGLMRAQRLVRTELVQRTSAERALRDLNESLELRVAARTAELRQMVDGLESFNRSVSHDLRGPLGGIAGIAQIARDALGHQDVDKAERLLAAIQAQAESSARLVSALLALARVDNTPLAQQPLALNEFVPVMVDRLRDADPSAPPPPVVIRRPLPVVLADPDLLSQVFINLLSNAIKFSRTRERPQVEVGSLRQDGEIVIYIQDNGVGFSAEQAAQLFQPFQRQHGSDFEGHGVGLSIVRRIVERHGGRIWAHSQAGEGARFMFTLPLAAPASL